MNELIDFGYVVEETRHQKTVGPNRDPEGNCTAHASDPPDPDCRHPDFPDLDF